MKKYFFAIAIIAIGYYFLNTPSTCFAVDKGGCLACHRYPGLVKLEKSDNLKVLHIDEEKHLNSPHGKVDCRTCHTQVTQVPHTGETKVECTTNCHVDDKEKIMAMDSASLSAYHRFEKFTITRLEDKSSCRVCHPLYPHSKNNKVRAFINMHTGFVLCEVCHLKKENLKNLTYEWKDPEVFEFTGEPYGTHQKRESDKTRETKSLISKMLRIFSSEENNSEGTPKTEYLISRIAVFSLKEGKKTLLMNTRDNKKAKEFNDKEKNLSSKKKEEKLKYFHRDIARKEISMACNECHSPNGMLDFTKLGFDQKTTKDLQYMNIKSLITKYETFVIPNLFGH